MDKLLSPSQVAQRYGVTTRTVYRWIDEERLTAYRVGRQLLRVRENDLRAIESAKTATTDDNL